MPNNIRDEIIDRLREAFESARDNPPAVSGKPVQLVSVMERFTLPTALDVNTDLPAVSFGYGGSRLVDGAFTQEEENIFSVYVYPIVPILPEFEDMEHTGRCFVASRHRQWRKRYGGLCMT